MIGLCVTCLVKGAKTIAMTIVNGNASCIDCVVNVNKPKEEKKEEVKK